MKTFQDILLNLQSFWASKNCILQQSHDLQTGAGTFNPETFLRALGPEPYSVCNVEISRRPTDGRYGKNPNRLQRFHQFQVMIKPTPSNMQQLYLESLEAIGFKLENHDIRFVHDDWESPTQGASGLGWEVWCDGMEITQFTYFQQIGGVTLTEIPAELAYGVERIALFLQKQTNVYDLAYNQTLTYGDVFLDAEVQYSRYNFEEANVSMWEKKFEACEAESKRLLDLELPIPAYDMAIEASHCFNMLDARGAISTTARVSMIHRVRELCCGAAEGYIEHRKKTGFSLSGHTKAYMQQELLPVEQISKEKVDFLLEVGSEHLPANGILMAIDSLESNMKEFLMTHKIGYDSLEVFATPRRLALYISNLETYTKEYIEEKKGPFESVAFDESGAVTKQGEGFFKSTGLEITSKKQLEFEDRIKVVDGRLIFTLTKEKLFVGSLLQGQLKALILATRFPKKMRWGQEGFLFSRPITSLVVLLDKQIIDLEIEGVRSSNKVWLHAQMDGKTALITKPSEYQATLKKGFVLASISERKASIDAQLDELEKQYHSQVVHREKVTSMVLFLSENPILALGVFDEKFLYLPEELIFSEMIDHQKYWPMRASDGKVSTKFVVAVDKHPSSLIISNNEGVLRARLSDGLFLFEKDLHKSFEEWNKKLSQVTLHPQLGSIYNKVERICTLSEKIASALELTYEKKAALYCKADLVSDVVYEFPELQGTMGKYYALRFGENQEVANGIEESYLPIGEGRALPKSASGIVVALADRMDHLMSYMGIGLVPTSSKDPYALRRAAIGINRILIESKLFFDLRVATGEESVALFIIARMKALLKDFGFDAESIEMCGIYDSFDPYKIFTCVKAISRLKSESDAFRRLLEVYKRVKGSVSHVKQSSFKEHLLVEREEKNLYALVKHLEHSFPIHLKEGHFEKAFHSLTELVAPLESFFEKVRVNTDDAELSKNRVGLLMIPYKLISATLLL